MLAIISDPGDILQSVMAALCPDIFLRGFPSAFVKSHKIILLSLPHDNNNGSLTSRATTGYLCPDNVKFFLSLAFLSFILYTMISFSSE